MRCCSIFFGVRSKIQERKGQRDFLFVEICVSKEFLGRERKLCVESNTKLRSKVCVRAAVVLTCSFLGMQDCIMFLLPCHSDCHHKSCFSPSPIVANALFPKTDDQRCRQYTAGSIHNRHKPSYCRVATVQPSLSLGLNKQSATQLTYQNHLPRRALHRGFAERGLKNDRPEHKRIECDCCKRNSTQVYREKYYNYY